MPKIVTNREFLSKIEPYILPVILVLIGLTAFGLGRLSTAGEQGPRLIINNAPAVTQTAAVAVSQNSGKYVASKSGTKYYLPSCSGVSKIKEENRVWFVSVAQAQAAGYTAAANCPGL